MNIRAAAAAEDSSHFMRCSDISVSSFIRFPSEARSVAAKGKWAILGQSRVQTFLASYFSAASNGDATTNALKHHCCFHRCALQERGSRLEQAADTLSVPR
jgi:hypothetical protein